MRHLLYGISIQMNVHIMSATFSVINMLHFRITIRFNKLEIIFLFRLFVACTMWKSATHHIFFCSCSRCEGIANMPDVCLQCARWFFLLHWQPILRNCKGLFCATCRLAMPHLFRTTVSYLNINDLLALCIRYDETLPHCITIAKKCFTLSISFLLLSLFPVCPFSSSLIAKGTKMHNKEIHTFV